MQLKLKGVKLCSQSRSVYIFGKGSTMLAVLAVNRWGTHAFTLPPSYMEADPVLPSTLKRESAFLLRIPDH